MEPEFFPLPVIGTRVVIRYRLQPEELGTHGEQFSDALGYLLVVGETHAEVETRGGIVAIERSAITHAKSVPPPPPRRPRGGVRSPSSPHDVI